MEDAASADFLRDMARSDRTAYFEQRLFVWSPLGTFWTALVIFLILIGTYLAAALVSGDAI